MEWATGLLTLLHVLVFVYWLGADLGVFVASYGLIDPKRPVPARLTALGIQNGIDLGPRFAMILAFPTGLTLAAHKGWLAVPAWALAAVWLVAAIWLAAGWRLRRLPAPVAVQRLDLGIRWAALLGFAGVGLGIVAGRIEAPLFIGIKLLLLAGAVLAGMMIRRALLPLIAAVRTMAKGGATAETDRAIRHASLWRVKPWVVTIWVLVAGAALAGITTPT